MSVNPFGNKARASEPKRGGSFRLALNQGSASDVLDPAKFLAPAQYILGMAMANCLVELSGTKKPIPELAERWEFSKDFKDWVFYLRSGVRFHNGKTLEAGDVVYSLRRHIGPDTASSGKGLLSDVSSVDEDGPSAVRIKLKTGTPDLAYALANYQFIIVPKDFSDWEHFVGTGPYKLKTYNPGVRFEGVRNEEYWKPNSAWFDDVTFTYINDPSAAVNALMSGQVDGIGYVAAEIAERLKGSGKFSVIANNTNYLSLPMATSYKPFANPDVRNAIKALIDRPKMVNFITRGYGVVGNDHPIPPSDPYYNSSIPQREYDPEKAKSLLKKAGLSSLDLDLHVAEIFAGAVDSTAILQESAAAGGVNIKIQREPVDGYWSNVWLKKPFLLCSTGIRSTPDLIFSLFFACDANWNDARWCNREFDKLLIEGRSTADFDKRKAIYGEMQRIIAEDGSNPVFMFPALLDVYQSSVAGLAADSTRPFMGLRVAERAWFQD
nr:ABC transporter substrate-binding protein [Mesorhizobium sp. WSM4875]